MSGRSGPALTRRPRRSSGPLHRYFSGSGCSSTDACCLTLESLSKGAISSAPYREKAMHSMPHSMPLRRLIPVFLLTLLLLPAAALAQDATITGTITDATGGVLPGVTITATHEATGNTFVAVSDATGAFRLPVRTGAHRVTAELSGFATVMRNIDLLVRQTAVLNLQLSPSTVQESVTVTGEAPLVDIAHD